MSLSPRLFRAVLAIATLASIGCKDTTGPASNVVSLSVTPINATMSGGTTKQLAVTVSDRNGNRIDGRTIHWSTSKPEVASVSLTGLVTTNPVDGTVDITASVDGVSATATISVTTFARMAVGAGFSCALDVDGTAHCWGRNDRGQLGNGTTTDRLTPTKVATNIHFVAITAGDQHACAIQEGGLAYCWGANNFLQTGGGPASSNQTTPVAVGGGVKFVSVAAGTNSSCGTTSDFDVFCWGHISYTDFFGDALAGVTTSQATKIGTNMVAVVSSIDGRYCSVDPGSLAYCWDLLYTYPQTGPVIPPIGSPVSTSIHFATLRLGRGHVCGLDTSGRAYCWGNNFYGQLGDGSTTNHDVPTPVAGGLVFQSLAAGGTLVSNGVPFAASQGGYSCGLATSGKAYCWGYNAEGELGIGTSPTGMLAPWEVAGAGVLFTGLRAGANHTCGLSTTGAAYCWGDNTSGQLGDGTTKSTPKLAPVFGN